MTVLDVGPAQAILPLLEERVPEKTRAHCISTAEYMATYAELLGLEVERVVVVGLLHDFAKGLSGKELLAKAEEYGIPVNETQRAKPKLLHGAVSAVETRQLGLVDDPEVYEAIYWHTTGRPGLSVLGLAVYFADFAEPLRTIPQAAEARKRLLTEGFRKALLYVSEQKLGHISTKRHCDPMTEEFHAWLEAQGT